jgi:putative transposase
MRTRYYPSDLTDAQWALVAPHIPSAKSGGRPRTTDVRAVLDAIIYLLRTGCQWRQLPGDFPPWPTVHGYFRGWRMAGVWVLLHRALYPQARLAAGRRPDPTVVIMDGQSVKTAQQGGVRGFDGHKRVKGRKRHILVDILGLPIANRVEPANMSDRRAGGRLLAGLAPLWPTIQTVIADAGHETSKLARQLRYDGWNLQIVKRKQRAFKVTGLTWIVERSIAWLGFNRRLSKDYERYVQTSETLPDIAAIRLMLNRAVPG